MTGTIYFILSVAVIVAIIVTVNIVGRRYQKHHLLTDIAVIGLTTRFYIFALTGAISAYFLFSANPVFYLALIVAISGLSYLVALEFRRRYNLP